MEKGNLLDRFIEQLDTLIPFMAIAYEDVFDLIQREKYIWFTDNLRGTLPDTYEIFRTQVSHSAFLLGYSYSEVFMGDLIREIYLKKPEMLPKDKQIKFGEVLETKSIEEVLDRMIDIENRELFHQGMEKIIECFEKKLNLTWSAEQKKKMILASSFRNCIMHNMSRADSRLAHLSDYKTGQPIQLDTSTVDSFGLMVRGLARNLYQQATDRYFSK